MSNSVAHKALIDQAEVSSSDFDYEAGEGFSFQKMFCFRIWHLFVVFWYYTETIILVLQVILKSG